MGITSFNPATGQKLKDFEELTEQEVESKLQLAHKVYNEHQRTAPRSETAKMLNKLADLMESDTDRLARIVTEEMGKPIAAAKSEVEKCAKCCRWDDISVMCGDTTSL